MHETNVGCEDLPRHQHEQVRVEAIRTAVNKKCSCCTDVSTVLFQKMKLDAVDYSESEQEEEEEEEEDLRANSLNEKRHKPYSVMELLTMPSLFEACRALTGKKDPEDWIRSQEEFESWKLKKVEEFSPIFDVSATRLRSKAYISLYTEWKTKSMAEIRNMIGSQTRDLLGYFNILKDLSRFHGLSEEKEEGGEDSAIRIANSTLPQKLAYCLLRESRERGEFFVPYNLWDPELSPLTDNLRKRRMAATDEKMSLQKKKKKQKVLNDFFTYCCNVKLFCSCLAFG